jgi:hypothetical protein
MYAYYLAYAWVNVRNDGGVEVHVMSSSDGFPDEVLSRAVRTLAIRARSGQGYWIICEADRPIDRTRFWFRPYRPRPSKLKRFYTVPGTGRMLDES